MSLIVDIKKELGGFVLRAAFEAKEGVAGLLGPSGSGKTMTLKCIAGIERPDSGHIQLNGNTLFDSEKGINIKPQLRQVGYMFQNYALFPNMTVKQNMLCGANRERDRAKKKALCEKYIKLLGLSGLEERYPSELSGGEQQRVALGRILVGRPKLIMLDEPFAALDSHLRNRLLTEMKGLLKSFGGPAIAVTHSREEAWSLCDTVALMDGGQTLTHKETMAVFGNPETVKGAEITGCRNIAPAKRAGEHSLYVPDWGITLSCAVPVREDVMAVGIHDRHFEDTESNAFPVEILDRRPDPFGETVRFRYACQRPGSPDLWRSGAPLHRLGVSPEKVMALYQWGGNKQKER